MTAIPRINERNRWRRKLSLDDQRHGVVLAALRSSGARSVLDLGCSEGKFLRLLLEDRQFERIVGLDVSVQSLQRAVKRLGYDRLPPKQKERIQLIHGSLSRSTDRRLRCGGRHRGDRASRSATLVGLGASAV